jgi:hypothetical protein
VIFAVVESEIPNIPGPEIIAAVRIVVDERSVNAAFFEVTTIVPTCAVAASAIGELIVASVDAATVSPALMIEVESAAVTEPTADAVTVHV